MSTKLEYGKPIVFKFTFYLDFDFFSKIDNFVKIFYTTMVSFSRTLDVTLIILFSCHKDLKCNKYSCATVKKKWLQ